MKINQCIIKCTFHRPLDQKVKAKDLRGALAHLYADDVLFHHHEKDCLIYKYPLIQYKIIERNGVVVGMGQGASAVARVNVLDKLLNIRDKQYIVENCVISFFKNKFGVSERQIEYRFLSPWLALNENNYKKYQRLGTHEKKIKMLEKILTGNIISVSKGVGYTISDQINVSIFNIREVNTKLKGTSMIGFLGAFSVNFEIPDFWGIGKSVARGFGTIKI